MNKNKTPLTKEFFTMQVSTFNRLPFQSTINQFRHRVNELRYSAETAAVQRIWQFYRPIDENGQFARNPTDVLPGRAKGSTANIVARVEAGEPFGQVLFGEYLKISDTFLSKYLGKFGFELPPEGTLQRDIATKAFYPLWLHSVGFEMFGVAPLTRFVRDHISPELADKIVQVYKMTDEADDNETSYQTVDRITEEKAKVEEARKELEREWNK